MRQRVITGILFVFVILAFAVPGFWWPQAIVLMMSVIGIMGTRELVLAVRAKALDTGWFFPFLGVATSLIPLFVSLFSSSLHWAFSIYAIITMGFSIITVILVVIFHKKDMAFPDGVAAAGILLYVSLPMASANLLVLFLEKGWFFFVLGIASPWISDVFAFFTGVLIGKHKIVPRISPKKTWEGCIGGAVMCGVVTALYFAFVVVPALEMKESVWISVLFGAALGVFLSVVSQLGDWMASSIKRWTGIKDFGKILPGHGGILDRFDSAFFTLPVTFGMILLFMKARI